LLNYQQLAIEEWRRDVPFTDLRIDSIADPHLDGESGAIIAFTDETLGLIRQPSLHGADIKLSQHEPRLPPTEATLQRHIHEARKSFSEIRVSNAWNHQALNVNNNLI
jgi:hypothetical protein